MTRLHAFTKCRSCQAPIAWRRTTLGQTIPLDPDPVAAGNIRHTGGYHTNDYGQRTPIVEVLTQTALALDDDPTYVSHFATCPNADTHRRPR